MWMIFVLVITVVIIVALGGYGWYVTHKIGVANAAMDKSSIVADTETTWQWVDAKLIGWKTILLAWLAGIPQIFSYVTTDVVTGWQSLPWVQVFDAKIAGWITIACAMLIPLTHAAGVKTAAQATPTDTE